MMWSSTACETENAQSSIFRSDGYPIWAVIAVAAVSAYETWTPVLDPAAAFLAPLIGGVIGALSGTYPAMRASRQEPIKAFRN